MHEVRIAELANHDGERVGIRGWLYGKRGSKKLQFLQVRDGSGILQAIVSLNDLGEEVFSLALSLTQESCIELEGEVHKDDRAPGGFELLVKDLRLLSGSENYPITPKEHGIDYLLERRHLWLRSKIQHAVLTIRATLIRSIRDFLDGEGFLLVDAPVFTPSSVEGTTTLFTVDYFDEDAYLTQSGQLYNEAAAAAFGKVYCFGPAFRAEKSKTRRHLTEFWMVEPEMAFADLDDVMETSERMLEYITGRVLHEHRDLLENVLERDVSVLEKIKAPFPRVHYDEAVQVLQDMGRDFEWGNDFGAEDETALSGKYERPIFVHHFPTAIKAFYMEPDPESEKHCMSVDCLASEGYGEIIGGGARSSDLELLEKRIEEHGLPREPYEWYLDLRRYGSFPHAGFGLGVERTLAWLTGRKHVRECIPFPRMMYRIKP